MSYSPKRTIGPWPDYVSHPVGVHKHVQTPKSSRRGGGGLVEAMSAPNAEETAYLYERMIRAEKAHRHWLSRPYSKGAKNEADNEENALFSAIDHLKKKGRQIPPGSIARLRKIAAKFVARYGDSEGFVG